MIGNQFIFIPFITKSHIYDEYVKVINLLSTRKIFIFYNLLANNFI